MGDDDACGRTEERPVRGTGIRPSAADAPAKHTNCRTSSIGHRAKAKAKQKEKGEIGGQRQQHPAPIPIQASTSSFKLPASTPRLRRLSNFQVHMGMYQRRDVTVSLYVVCCRGVRGLQLILACERLMLVMLVIWWLCRRSCSYETTPCALQALWAI